MFICKWYNGRGPMVWMSSIMDGNKHEGKWLVAKYNAFRWTKENNAPPKWSPWQVPMANGMTMTSPSQFWWL